MEWVRYDVGRQPHELGIDPSNPLRGPHKASATASRGPREPSWSARPARRSCGRTCSRSRSRRCETARGTAGRARDRAQPGWRRELRSRLSLRHDDRLGESRQARELLDRRGRPRRIARAGNRRRSTTVAPQVTRSLPLRGARVRARAPRRYPTGSGSRIPPSLIGHIATYKIVGGRFVVSRKRTGDASAIHRLRSPFAPRPARDIEEIEHCQIKPEMRAPSRIGLRPSKRQNMRTAHRLEVRVRFPRRPGQLTIADRIVLPSSQSLPHDSSAAAS